MRGSGKKAFGYVVRHDLNFAPHVSDGLLSLACCKPDIRRTAEKNSILVGFSSKKRCVDLRIVYWARVESKQERDQYWKQHPKRRWDNIYEPDGGWFILLENGYHGPKREEIKGDMKCHSVLLAKEYCCFGRGTSTFPGIPIPKGFSRVIDKVNRAPRANHRLDDCTDFLKWIERKARHCSTKTVQLDRRDAVEKWNRKKGRDVCDEVRDYWTQHRAERKPPKGPRCAKRMVAKAGGC